MNPIKVLIVEDKVIVAESIATVLRNHSLDVVGICDTGEEAIRLVKTNPPDLVLMDIELAGALDGISTAKMIQEDHQVTIIYLSDYTDQKTVNRAKKTMPANYLSKPFTDVDLLRAIDIAFYNANAQGGESKPSLLRGHVFLRTDSQIYVKLAFSEIIYLQAQRSYCDVVTENRTYSLSKSLNHVSDQIQNKDFVRVSRSTVVNVNKITALNGNIIKMGDKEVLMSKELRDSLLLRFKFLK